MEKSKMMMIIIIVLLVLLLGAIGFLAYLALQLSSKIEAEGEKGAVVAVQDALQLTPDQITQIPLADPISTNLLKSADGKEHAIRLRVVVCVNNTDKKLSPGMITLVTENQSIIKNDVIEMLLAKTKEDLIVEDGFTKLAEAIKIRLQEEFKSNLIVRVLLDDWYIQ